MACEVTVTGGTLSREETDLYVERARRVYGREPARMRLALDGDFVDVDCTFTAPFERIRRITGYLVGTLERFNDGKRAEERDRVRHSLG
ncbi:MAG TPA: anaerobic ribonucleoside-triphosphate reductase [Candidatus Limnocylindria bacterium]|nr:anaerobic ribonucleoside-triphosphate reductase [Candidatus Limnocylindria bacterium]